MDLLNQLKTKHKFRDPIYGFIEVTDSELEIIDTPLFQRLRRVHQLALEKYVYPTAEHSRFAHSLGVLQSATNMFLNIVNHCEVYGDIGLLSISEIDKKKDILNKFKTLRYAALLHDVGHLPFSHAAEDLLLDGKSSHEHIGQFIIENYEPITNVIEDDGINPKLVSALLGDKVLGEYKILKSIVSGQLDADRADYLRRDSYCCGVKYGEYDYDRYIHSFFLKRDEHGIPQLCVEEKNIYLIESFLLARYHYNLQVPFHRTRVGYDIVLKRYIQHLKENGAFKDFIRFDGNSILEIDYDEFQFFDDYTLFEMIKNDVRSKNNIWANILMRQGHLVPIYDNIREHQSKDNYFLRILHNLITDLGLTENENVFRKTQSVKVSKLIKINDAPNTPSKQGIALGLIRRGEDVPHDILNYSNILRQLVDPIEFYRIYVTQENATAAQTAADAIINYEKEIQKT